MTSLLLPAAIVLYAAGYKLTKPGLRKLDRKLRMLRESDSPTDPSAHPDAEDLDRLSYLWPITWAGVGIIAILAAGTYAAPLRNKVLSFSIRRPPAS